MTALASRHAAPIGARSTERCQAPAGRADRSVRPEVARPQVVASSSRAAVAARSCSGVAPVPAAGVRPRVGVGEAPVVVTRLTDRGLALVLALVALFVVAGVACVGLTAARVMSDAGPMAAAAASR
ncbi:hypothetical protein GCM10027418_29670 [Mariniluteicoccus endophyticus]